MYEENGRKSAHDLVRFVFRLRVRSMCSASHSDNDPRESLRNWETCSLSSSLCLPCSTSIGDLLTISLVTNRCKLTSEAVLLGLLRSKVFPDRPSMYLIQRNISLHMSRTSNTRTLNVRMCILNVSGSEFALTLVAHSCGEVRQGIHRCLC